MNDKRSVVIVSVNAHEIKMWFTHFNTFCSELM